MSMTMEEIKAQYPVPLRHTARRQEAEQGYCVGGACMLTAGEWDLERKYVLYPSPYSLAKALCLHNPALPVAHARWYATRIIHDNDMGAFTAAWGMVNCALQFDPTRRAV